MSWTMDILWTYVVKSQCNPPKGHRGRMEKTTLRVHQTGGRQKNHNWMQWIKTTGLGLSGVGLSSPMQP